MDDTDDHRSNVTDFRDRAGPATSGWRSPPNSQRAESEALALLTTCLALVRPVGFTDDNARDWLMVAVGEVAHIPTGILANACTAARRTATHHAQIIPAIIAAAEPELRERARIDEYVAGFEYQALPAPPITPPAIEEVRELQNIIGKAAKQFSTTEQDRWTERRAAQAPLHRRVKLDPNAPRSIAEMLAARDANG